MRTATNVVQLSTVHPRDDIRIFHKECATLRDAGYTVHLVVADGLGDEERQGIRIHDVGRASGRLGRMVSLPSRAFRKAAEIGAKVIHFHDPELLPTALLSRGKGALLVYDAHEDLPRAVLSKHWIARPLRRAVSIAVEIIENFSARRMTAVVVATPHIGRRFSGLGTKVTGVYNYPNMPKLAAERGEPAARTFCYVGSITRHRSIFEMIRATALADARLLLAGRFEDAQTEAEARAMPEWRCVDYLGMLPHEQVWAVMQQSQAGLLFFHPEPNHINSLPNKMFEYMAAGLPVLCSDFPDWREIVVKGNTGLVGDPLDPVSIAALMRKISDDPEGARDLGLRGRELVSTSYRWENEGAKLVRLYGDLASRPAS